MLQQISAEPRLQKRRNDQQQKRHYDHPIRILEDRGHPQCHCHDPQCQHISQQEHQKAGLTYRHRIAHRHGRIQKLHRRIPAFRPRLQQDPYGLKDRKSKIDHARKQPDRGDLRGRQPAPAVFHAQEQGIAF